MPRIAIIGRTRTLLRSAEALAAAGHQLVLVATNPPEAEYGVTANDFENLARRHGCPFLCSNRLDRHLHLPIFMDCGADVGISVNWKTIITDEFIRAFPLGILNAHGGDLPRYRGNACQAWAIINGEPRIGLCVHKMVGGELDSGDIIARDFLSIDLSTTITRSLLWIEERAPGLFVEAVEKLARNPSYILEKQSSHPDNALRCYPRRPEDGRIDWRQNSIDILRLVNASTPPYPGAFCEFEGRKVVIWKASLAPEEKFLAIPGQVTTISSDYVEVATGKGKLRIIEVGVEGKNMPPSTLVRSTRQRFT